jgi:hypothetical protein
MWESQKARCCWEDLGVGRKIKWVWEKLCGIVETGFIWHRILTSALVNMVKNLIVPHKESIIKLHTKFRNGRYYCFEGNFKLGFYYLDLCNHVSK